MGGILMLASTALGVFGQIQQGRAESASYAAKAKADQMNAELAGINSDIARSDAKIEQARAAEEAHKAMGKQRAALAQGGMLYSATGDLLQEESQRNADDQQLAISRQGELEALNYKIQKTNALNSSSIYKANAKSAKSGSYLGAAGTLLSGTSKAYGHWSDLHSGSGK